MPAGGVNKCGSCFPEEGNTILGGYSAKFMV